MPSLANFSNCAVLPFVGLFWAVLTAPMSTQAQSIYEHNLHLVSFTDKACQSYSLFHAQAFLSPRTLERRAQQGILVDSLDLPLCNTYVQNLTNLGIEIHAHSRWFNAVSIHCGDTLLLKKIKQLPFVKQVTPLGKFRAVQAFKWYSRRPPIDSSKHRAGYYGAAQATLELLKGNQLHHLGYTGEQIQVAIVDGGFRNAYRMTVFDSLYLEGRLLGTHDFVEGDDFVYESSTHGTNVLSILAAKRPHLLVGTAPDASFYLFKTEDSRGEYRAEEFYWALAVEYADQVGVDVVSSSLGYNIFRDPRMSYSTEQLDGQQTLISQAAQIAVRKGLFIVNAAGNSGHKEWRHLLAPADVAEVLTIGGSNKEGKRARFSSVGPTADGRIKPDLVAPADRVAYASMIEYNVGFGEGTSYACPTITGMVVGLKQAFPEASNAAIRAALKQNASQASQPDVELGYGIPDCWAAYQQLTGAWVSISPDGIVQQGHQFVQDKLTLFFQDFPASDVHYHIYDWNHQLLQSGQHQLTTSSLQEYKLEHLGSYPSGIYRIQLVWKEEKVVQKAWFYWIK